MKASGINASAGLWARSNPSLRAQFLERAHTLLDAGFARVDRHGLAQAHEPEITSRLCDAINCALRDPGGPSWHEHFSCHEDPPLPDSDRLGKKRDRADFKIEMTARPRPELFVEAKSLRAIDAKNLGAYTGDDGMGCFIAGRYASAYNFGAMLAYVCTGTVGEWVRTLDVWLAKERASLGVRADGPAWETAAELGTTGQTRHSWHARAQGDPIELFHSFFLCVEPHNDTAP